MAPDNSRLERLGRIAADRRARGGQINGEESRGPGGQRFDRDPKSRCDCTAQKFARSRNCLNLGGRAEINDNAGGAAASQAAAALAMRSLPTSVGLSMPRDTFRRRPDPIISGSNLSHCRTKSINAVVAVGTTEQMQTADRLQLNRVMAGKGC